MPSNQNDNNLPNKDQPKPDPKKDDAYAQALLQTLNANLEMDQETKPAANFISKKKLIYLAIIVLAAIILVVAASALIKTPSVNLDIDNQFIEPSGRY